MPFHFSGKEEEFAFPVSIFQLHQLWEHFELLTRDQWKQLGKASQKSK